MGFQISSVMGLHLVGRADLGSRYFGVWFPLPASACCAQFGFSCFGMRTSETKFPGADQLFRNLFFGAPSEIRQIVMPYISVEMMCDLPRLWSALESSKNKLSYAYVLNDAASRGHIAFVKSFQDLPFAFTPSAINAWKRTDATTVAGLVVRIVRDRFPNFGHAINIHRSFPAGFDLEQICKGAYCAGSALLFVGAASHNRREITTQKSPLARLGDRLGVN